MPLWEMPARQHEINHCTKTNTMAVKLDTESIS